MRRLIPALTAALFSAVTFSAYAIDELKDNNPPPPQEKQAKKKKSESPVQQSGDPTDQSGQGAAQSSGAGGVQEGGNAPVGDPTGTTMTPGGAATGAASRDQSPYNKQ